jgi:hypothetical protein
VDVLVLALALVLAILLVALAVAGAFAMIRRFVRAAPAPGRPEPSSPLERARIAVADLTPQERDRLRLWMEERWPARGPADDRFTTPGDAGGDDRITR